MKLTKEQKRRERKRRFKAAKAWLADHWQFNEADAQAKRPGQEILKEDVYQTYLTYCTRDNVDPVANSIFGKALHRVFPGVKSVRKGPRGKAKHHYKYLTQREDVPGADTAALGAPDATIKPVRKTGGAARRKMHMRKKNLNWKAVNNPANPTKTTAGSKRTLAQMNDTPISPPLRSFASSSAISDSRGNSHSNKRNKTAGMSNSCVSSTQHTVSSTVNLPLRRSSRKRKAVEIQDEEESDEEEVEVTATVQAKKKKRTTRILSDSPSSTTTTSATRHFNTTNQEPDDEQPEKGIFEPCGMHSSVPNHQNSNLEFLVKFLDKFDEKKENNPAHLEKEDTAEAEYPRQTTSPYLYTTTTTHHSYHYPHKQLLEFDLQSQNTFAKRTRDSPPPSSVPSPVVLETSPTHHDSLDEYYFVSPPLQEDSCPSTPQAFQTNNLWPASWCCKIWHEIAAIKGRYLRYLDSLRGSFAHCCSRGDLEDCRIVVSNFWQEEASRGTYHLFEDDKLRAALLAAEEDFFCSLVSDTATFDRHFILDFADHMAAWIRHLVPPDLSRVFLADLVQYYKAFSQQVQAHVLYDCDSLFQSRPFIPAQAEMPSASSSFSVPCDSYANMQAYNVRESRGREEEYAVWPV